MPYDDFRKVLGVVMTDKTPENLRMDLVVLWSEEHKKYLAVCKQYPALSGVGATYNEAFASLLRLLADMTDDSSEKAEDGEAFVRWLETGQGRPYHDLRSRNSKGHVSHRLQ